MSWRGIQLVYEVTSYPINWRKCLAAMVAILTGNGLTPEVNFREPITYTSVKSEVSILVFKSRGDFTRNEKQGYP